MSEAIKNIIEYEEESTRVDFKLEQYPIEKSAAKKSDFLKDISAMANFPSDDDKYIVIGLKKKNGKILQQKNVESFYDQAIYQKYLNDNIEPEIQFEYIPATHNGQNVGYFRIFGNKNRPYLFKKEVKSPDGTKTLFREGDGYMRTGSSTRRMVRSDFERIYESRYRHPDRKGDISIIPRIGRYQSEDIDAEGLWYFDIAIRNKSKKSIGLDVEMKVFKSGEFSLISEPDLRDQVFEMRRKEQRNPFEIAPVTPPVHLNLYVSCTEHEDCILMERFPSRMEKTAIDIPQEKTEDDVFSRQLIVLSEKPASIQAAVIIRSDDFSEGALTDIIRLDAASWPLM